MSNPSHTVRAYLIDQLSPSSTATVTVANGTATTLSVSAEGEFAVQDQLKIEDEIIYVSAVSSDGSKTITAVRGVCGTAGAAHSAETAKIINVFTPRFPDDYVPDKKCVVFVEIGGVNDVYIPPLRNPLFQFECYGPTESDASEVYEELYAALQALNNQDVGSQTIKAAHETMVGIPMMNEDGE